MPQHDPIQSNFTAGEIAPNVLGNVELEKYKQGLNKCENFIVEPSGGVRRRGGFKYVATVKDSSKDTILVEFSYKGEYSYILEFGNLYIRFYRNQAQIVDGELSAIEVVTTYTEAELRELRFTQDEENLYIVHKNHLPAILSRTSHIAWTLEDLQVDTPTSFSSVCWSPELGIFCGVSDDTPDNIVGISEDGSNWYYYPSAADNYWQDVCWSPELGLFCAVATSGTGNRVMTSPDGKVWTERTPAEDNYWMSVCWSADLALFCAVAFSGTNRVMTSPDGVTWTARAASSASNWMSVCWSADLTLFCAVANTTVTTCVMTSPDGITWTGRTASTNAPWKSVCWNAELTLFCAVSNIYVGGSGNSHVMTSPDGVTWTGRTAAATDVQWAQVIWSKDVFLFVAVGWDNTDVTKLIMTSPNGITWTSRAAEKNYIWTGVCWSYELNLFVAVADPLTPTTDAIMTSPDGITWTQKFSSGVSPSEWTIANYPTLCWFFEQRLFFAATPNQSNRVWGSHSANYLNFDAGTGLDNEAIIVTLKDVKKLLWATVSNTIVLGASNGVFKLASNNLNEAMTPTNVRPLRLTQYGCSSVPALDIAGNAVFLQKGLRKLRKLEYEYVNNRYTAIDIFILGNHLTKSGLTELKYIDEPEAIIYGVRTDGQLMGICYEPEYKIFGGFRHIIGGTDVVVKSIAVSDAVSANKDELWAIISRTVNSATVQYVEFLTQGLTSEDDIVDATFVESFVTKTGDDFTLFDGLDHLEGETVQVFADGVAQTPQVVDKGTITITAADKAHAGLQYISTLETLPLEGGNPIGTAMGKIKRIVKLVLRLLRSGVFKSSDLLDNTQETITPGTLPYTGDTEELDFYGTHETGGQIKIVVDDPVPYNLLAIMYKARTGE